MINLSSNKKRMANTKPHISIVTPVYGCKTCLEELYLRVKKTLDSMGQTFELIMVNDASPDDAWETITKLADKDSRIIGINFSRNFGQHYAITAGLDNSCGEWIVVMDCDLQDQPEEIPKLYQKAQEGYDTVLGRREVRNDSFLKKLGSEYFYKTLGYLTDTKQDSAVANFGIYHKKVISAIKSMNDNLRYFPAMVRWVGFKTTSINIEHAERFEGKSTYSIRSLIRLGANVILAFSDKPLKLIINLGLTISISSIIFAIYQLIKYKQGEIEILGWTTIVVSIWLLFGITIFILGVIGSYLGKVFERVKDRPKYIVKEQTNKN